MNYITVILTILSLHVTQRLINSSHASHKTFHKFFSNFFYSIRSLSQTDDSWLLTTSLESTAAMECIMRNCHLLIGRIVKVSSFLISRVRSPPFPAWNCFSHIRPGRGRSISRGQQGSCLIEK